MGFLQGIIADARPAASAAVTDASRPMISERREKINSSPSGSLTSGETGTWEGGFDAVSGLDAAAPDAGFLRADRQPSVLSSPGTDTTRSSRYDSITTESRMPASDNHDEHNHNHAALSVTVEYQSGGLHENYSTGMVVNSEADSSADYVEPSVNDVEPLENYREPSVFSVMPAEMQDIVQNDILPSEIPLSSGDEPVRVNNTAHEKIGSESLPLAGEFNPSEAGERAPITRQSLAEPGIEQRHGDSPPMSGKQMSDKHGLPGTRAGFVDAAPVRLSRAPAMQEGKLTEPASVETPRQSLSDNGEMQPSDTLASSANLSAPIPEQKTQHLSPTIPHRSVLLRENRNQQVPLDATTDAIAEVSTTHRPQRLTAQSDVSKRENNNSKGDAPSAGVNRLVDGKRTTLQAEVSASRQVRQQPARKPESPFMSPPPTPKVPEVKIGQVDVFIEAPRKKEAASARTARKIPQMLSSRHYLRRI